MSTLISKKNMELNKKFLLIGILFFILPNISALIVSEIMYAPLESEFYNEYIEIYNDGDSYVDLTNWTVCGDALLSGYIDHGDSEKLKLNDSIILPKGNYAIITDGESGTEVYSNFNVQQNALAIHVDAASLCGGLVNTGETIYLKDSSGNSINSATYDSSLANNNDKSMQLCFNSWIEEEPTPGKENFCQLQTSQNQPQNQTQTNPTTQSNNALQTQTQENTTLSTSATTKESSIISGSEQKTTTIENSAKEENAETIALNSNSKDIKSDEGTAKLSETKLSKNDYARYTLTGFVLLLASLFLLKKIFKKKYQNEFQN